MRPRPSSRRLFAALLLAFAAGCVGNAFEVTGEVEERDEAGAVDAGSSVDAGSAADAGKAGDSVDAGDPCGNRLRDGKETDVDCGGTDRAPCANGLHCASGADCTSRLCDAQTGTCQPAECTPQPRAQLCAGHCGTLQDRCGSPVDCGGCGSGTSCEPATHACTTCARPKEICDGACVDLDSDSQHCGDCAVHCGLSIAGVQLICSRGKCSVPLGGRCSEQADERCARGSCCVGFFCQDLQGC